MAFTYDLTLLNDNPLYQVRFSLGDVNEDTASFQDEEILYVLSLNNNDVLHTCIDCINALLPRLAQQPAFKVGPYSEDANSSAYSYWTKLLADLKLKVASYEAPIMLPPTGPPIFHYNMMGVDEYAEDS